MFASSAFQARRVPFPSTGPAPRQWAVLILPKSASGPDASYSLCEGYQNKASIFAIVCSVLKCSFDLEIRDKRDSWVAAFVATRVAPVPCQPPAGRQLELSKCYISKNDLFPLVGPSGPGWFSFDLTKNLISLNFGYMVPFSTLGPILHSPAPHTHETQPSL